VSDDTYKGFASGTGYDSVFDYGGSADRLDLRPLESSDVYFDAFDSDGEGTDESLRIVIDDATSVYGFFVPISGLGQKNGRIEQIVFSDETITSAAEVRSLVRASDEKEVAEASRELLDESSYAEGPEVFPAAR
jgi:hypothetical protein